MLHHGPVNTSYCWGHTGTKKQVRDGWKGDQRNKTFSFLLPLYSSSGFVNKFLSLTFFLIFFFQDWSGGVNRGHVSLKNYG